MVCSLFCFPQFSSIFPLSVFWVFVSSEKELYSFRFKFTSISKSGFSFPTFVVDVAEGKKGRGDWRGAMEITCYSVQRVRIFQQDFGPDCQIVLQFKSLAINPKIAGC